MNLTIDCILNAALADLRSSDALAQLMAKGKVVQLEKPLEVLICEQYGLQAMPDFPIAAISAATDGIDVGDAYWLRADPVHLVLQRDSFSLGEPIPLRVTRVHAERMVADLNRHFGQDGLVFVIGNSGAWYLRSGQSLQVKTTLPGVAAGKNMYQFLPQGDESSKWLAVLNEVQMLLHEHPANEARESTGDVAVNSIWLSGGGSMPQFKGLQHDINLMMANDVFHQGLANLADIPCQALPDNLDEVMQYTAQHVRLQLPPINDKGETWDETWDETWFQPLLSALKNKKIKKLILNLGFYEKGLIVEIKPLDTYKFWRKTKPMLHYLK